MADIINKKISDLPSIQMLNNGINYLAVTMANGAAKKNIRVPQSQIRSNLLGWNDSDYTSDEDKNIHNSVVSYTNWLSAQLSSAAEGYANTKSSQVLAVINNVKQELPSISVDACTSAMKEAHLSIFQTSSYTINYVNGISTELCGTIDIRDGALGTRITTNQTNIGNLQTEVTDFKAEVATDYTKTEVLTADLTTHWQAFDNLSTEYADLSAKVAITSADVAASDHAGRVRLGYTSNPGNGDYAVKATEDGDIYVHIAGGGGGGSNIPEEEWIAVSSYVIAKLQPLLGIGCEKYVELSNLLYSLDLASLKDKFSTYSDFNVCEDQYDVVHIDKSFNYNGISCYYVATDTDAPAEYGAGAKELVSADIVNAKDVDVDAGTYISLDDDTTKQIADLTEYTVLQQHSEENVYAYTASDIYVVKESSEIANLNTVAELSAKSIDIDGVETPTYTDLAGETHDLTALNNYDIIKLFNPVGEGLYALVKQYFVKINGDDVHIYNIDNSITVEALSVNTANKTYFSKLDMTDHNVSELTEYDLIQTYDRSVDEIVYVPSNTYVIDGSGSAIDKTDDIKQASMVMPYDGSFETVITYVSPNYSILNRIIELRQDLLYAQNELDDCASLSVVVLTADVSLASGAETTVDIDVTQESDDDVQTAISMPKIQASNSDIQARAVQMFNGIAHITVKNVGSEAVENASLSASVVYADIKV